MEKDAFWRGFLNKGTGQMSKKILAGYHKQMGEAGPSSFLMWLPYEAAKKIPGLGKKVERGMRNLELGALNADTLAGQIPHALTKKLPLVKNLFLQKDVVPYGKGMMKEVERTSLTAPLSKATDVAQPIVFGLAVDKGLYKLRKRHDEQTATL